MAGNIIPAIATTNAIVAGIVVMHAFNILTKEFEKCQSVYLRLKPNHRGQLFVPERGNSNEIINTSKEYGIKNVASYFLYNRLF